MLDPNAPEDALMRLIEAARTWERARRHALGAGAAALVAAAFAAARPGPAATAVAAVGLGVFVSLGLRWWRLRRGGAGDRAAMLARWEEATTRRDAALALLELAREGGGEVPPRAAIRPGDALLLAVDRRLTAELERRAAEDALRAAELRAATGDELRRREEEAGAREAEERAGKRRAMRRSVAEEFAGDAAESVARLDAALLAVEARLHDGVAMEDDRRAFMAASRSLRALMLLSPKSVVYEGRAPASTLGDDPAGLRRVVSDAEEGALAGRVVESAAAAGALAETARWAPYASLAGTITPEVRALFEPALAGVVAPDDELAPPPFTRRDPRR